MCVVQVRKTEKQPQINGFDGFGEKNPLQFYVNSPRSVLALITQAQMLGQSQPKKKNKCKFHFTFVQKPENGLKKIKETELTADAANNPDECLVRGPIKNKATTVTAYSNNNNRSIEIDWSL